LNDNTKFTKIDKDPTETLKKQLNDLIKQVNDTDGCTKMQRVVGHFEPGYIYANPKIHKRLIDPPFRPIISQIGTVTYEISKHLNDIIKKYIPKKYQAESTYEFLSMLKQCNVPGMLASLDVENLFTNVPVAKTIDIIIDNVFHSEHISPPKIQRHI
jgi:hypothetical protein